MSIEQHTLQQIVQRRSELAEELRERTSAFQAFRANYERETSALAEREALILAGFDPARVEAGRQIVHILGEVSDVRRGFYGDGLGVRAALLAEAKADLANGGDRIGRGYFGVKNYDAFGDQRCDCEYGMGPRHGSIVFSIGLTPALRQRVRTGPHLEDHEIEDALYLLSALPQIEKLRADQKKAA